MAENNRNMTGALLGRSFELARTSTVSWSGLPMSDQRVRRFPASLWSAPRPFLPLRKRVAAQQARRHMCSRESPPILRSTQLTSTRHCLYYKRKFGAPILVPTFPRPTPEFSHSKRPSGRPARAASPSSGAWRRCCDQRAASPFLLFGGLGVEVRKNWLQTGQGKGSGQGGREQRVALQDYFNHVPPGCSLRLCRRLEGLACHFRWVRKPDPPGPFRSKCAQHR